MIKFTVTSFPLRLILTNAIIIVLFSKATVAQWVPTEGPWGGPISSVAVMGNTVFAGTYGNGVFITVNNGTTWKTANSGLTELGIKSLVSQGNIICAITSNHVFISTDSGLQWSSFDAGLPVKPVECIGFCGNRIVAGTLGAGVFISPTSAADWKPINSSYIENKSIFAISTKEDTIFAASDGVYKSADSGASWTPINSSYYYQRPVKALAVTDKALYAGLDVGVIYTLNGGVTWSKSPERYIKTIAAVNGTVYAGSNSDTIITSADNGTSWNTIYVAGCQSINGFSGMGATLWAGTSGCGVITSADSGVNWTAVTTGIRNTSAVSLAVNGNMLYAATNADGVFCSTDRGANWRPVRSGLSNRVPTALTLYKNNVWAGTMAGVFASLDKGLTWTFINRFSTYPVISLGVVSNLFFAGTYREGAFVSTDDGMTWQQIPMEESQVNVYAFIECNGKTFTGTSAGVFRISDSLGGWTGVNSGLPSEADVQLLAVHGTDIFAGVTRKGMYRSYDNGSSWKAVNSGLDTNATFTSLVAGDSFIVAAAKGHGIFFSNNGGTVWKSADSGLENRSVYSLLIDGPDIFAGTGCGVWRRNFDELTEATKTMNCPNNPQRTQLAISATHAAIGRINIALSLPSADMISVAVYDIDGRKVATLAKNYFSAGSHRVPWNLGNVAKGCYFIVLKTGAGQMTSIPVVW